VRAVRRRRSPSSRADKAGRVSKGGGRTAAPRPSPSASPAATTGRRHCGHDTPEADERPRRVARQAAQYTWLHSGFGNRRGDRTVSRQMAHSTPAAAAATEARGVVAVRSVVTEGLRAGTGAGAGAGSGEGSSIGWRSIIIARNRRPVLSPSRSAGDPSIEARVRPECSFAGPLSFCGVVPRTHWAGASETQPTPLGWSSRAQKNAPARPRAAVAL
jgi:hypothetical protein